jgi:hypothetical protein
MWFEISEAGMDPVSPGDPATRYSGDGDPGVRGARRRPGYARDPACRASMMSTSSNDGGRANSPALAAASLGPPEASSACLSSSLAKAAKAP